MTDKKIWSLYQFDCSFLNRKIICFVRNNKKIYKVRNVFFLWKNPSKMLQNLPYFWNMKTHVVYSFLILCCLFFPCLCWHNLSHSNTGKKVAQNENNKNLCSFLYSKVVVNFKAFLKGIKSWAKTSFFLKSVQFPGSLSQREFIYYLLPSLLV